MTSVRVRLTFPDQLVREPIIAKLVSEHGVVPNIRRANVEDDIGWIVCEITGEREALDSAMAWLDTTGVAVDWLGDSVES